MNRPRNLHRDTSPGSSALFTGQGLVGVEHTGRVALPAAWKHRFQDSAFVIPRIKDEEPHIMLFSAISLQARLAELRSAYHSGVLLRAASEIKVDKQNRVVIPEVLSLLEGASHVAILGGGDHLKLMSEQSAAYATRYDEEVLAQIV